MSASDPKTVAAMDDSARDGAVDNDGFAGAVSGGFVSARSRKMMLVGAKKLDCRINMMARQFMGNRTFLLGMITPFRRLLGADYFGRVLQGVPQAVSGTGDHTVLFDSQPEVVNCA